jgi:hypothetical protein
VCEAAKIGGNAGLLPGLQEISIIFASVLRERPRIKVTGDR